MAVIAGDIENELGRYAVVAFPRFPRLLDGLEIPQVAGLDETQQRLGRLLAAFQARRQRYFGQRRHYAVLADGPIHRLRYGWGLLVPALRHHNGVARSPVERQRRRLEHSHPRIRRRRFRRRRARGGPGGRRRPGRGRRNGRRRRRAGGGGRRHRGRRNGGGRRRIGGRRRRGGRRVIAAAGQQHHAQQGGGQQRQRSSGPGKQLQHFVDRPNVGVRRPPGVRRQ